MDDCSVPMKQLMQEFSDDFGVEFIENLMYLRNHLEKILAENLENAGLENIDKEKLAQEIAKSTFDFTIRTIKPIWKKIHQIEREIKFLRQK
ncbi:MAG: hypothetical protein D6785_05965 [Planctomycetota bacterium]|nr:MAG: hypothetical protein D6785_05965 [Planctomycetota bacterium]